ncbi:hypothetical protein COCON_G00091070 [Conger conger]|uniref:RGS domain-containing protein n=1 Tax=Conger conger TaxID=82655 RepID=A0A9Q1DL05_CONCO|nr:regulator of G-protein signaling 2-like [Conger conger]KAJ8274482.1 hypothetical protein COCON_G00091070 [Conger conger]
MDIACVNCEDTSTLHEKKRIKHKTWRATLRYLLKRSSLTQESASKRRFCRLTLEELKQWELSLERLLSNPYGKAAFKVFLKSEFSEENMEFWLACEEFRKIRSSAKLTSTANRIYEEFIKSESPKEINLDCHTKDCIAQNLKQPTHSCFAGAQTKIYSLMENCSYPRFFQSQLYKDFCELAAGKET